MMRRWLILPAPLLLAAACNRTGVRPPPDATPETPQQTILRQAREIETLRRQAVERDAQVQRLRQELAVLQDLRPEYADAAVVPAKVLIGRYSHVADFDPSRPGPDGVKVYLYVYDRQNDKIKQAGRIELKAFDLKNERKLGDWVFSPREVLTHWRVGLLLDGYVFQLPWQEEDVGEVRDVTLHWRFEAVTGQTFEGTQPLTYSTLRAP